jgi:CRP-like cAMP-binding protein
MSLTLITAFKGLSQSALGRLQHGSITLEARDGTTIFEQGDPADAVYAIVAGDGRVRIGSIDRRSKALMVEVLNVGDIFGEIAVIDTGTRTATAVTQGQLQLIKIPAAAFLAVLADSPIVGAALSRIMARRLRRTFELFQDATFETLEIRLARQVLYLIDREGRTTPQGVRLALRFRQGDLADLLGGTTRSIITTLNAWRSAGLVEYDTERARLTVRDPAALRAIVGLDCEP